MSPLVTEEKEIINSSQNIRGNQSPGKRIQGAQLEVHFVPVMDG